ncbi:MAG: D-alanyl-D-alanine carboxypeptidase family protein [Mycobacteriales bacterium]
MRTTRGLRATAGLLLSALVVAGPAAAAAAPTAVGGPLLASRGTVVAAGAPALPATTASSWLVADLDTGEVLAAKSPHARYAPASTLKTLTALTLIPRLDPSRKVVPSFTDLNVDGSKVGLQEKVPYSVSTLFTSMLVVSGNDAANTLADANGGIAKTVQDMNAEAARIQALDTHAVNANGLDDPRQLTSAYDLALIGRAAMQIPAFRQYVATKYAVVRGRGAKSFAISTHDKLLYNYPGAIGIKNGYTVKAHATFVGAATRGGHTLIVTLLRTNPRYWPEAASLLDWGFKATAAKVEPIGQLVDPQQPAGPSPSAAPAARTVKAAATAAAGSTGLPLLPTGIVAAGSLVIVGSLVRGRRGRRPKRLTLPKL